MKHTRFVLLCALLLILTTTGAALADTISSAKRLQAGTSGEYEVQIANTTASRHNYELAVQSLPEGVRAAFVQDGPVVTDVSVDANSTGLVTLRLEVPRETQVGSYTPQVVATRDDGEVLKMLIVLEVASSYQLDIISHNMNTTTFRGQAFAIETSAANSGVVPLTNVTLALDMPAKWVSKVDPAVVASLKPGESVTFYATVSVPSSQVAIDQLVGVSVTSDQITSTTSQLTVRVQDRPDYLIAAAVIITGAALGTFGYFRLKGRR